MKKYLLLLLMLCLTTGMKAGSERQAKAVLDKTAKTIRSAGDFETAFTASTFVNEKKQGSLSGKIYLHGRQFHIVSDRVMYWFDGTNLWTYVKENKEVNLSTPSIYEQQDMNPYFFLSLYKRGFTYQLAGESNLRGRACQTVRLLSKGKEKIRELLIDIDKATSQPLCVRIRTGAGKWTRISIYNTKTHQKYSDSQFKFNKAEFPGTEVIDLR
jgi:outer membrane lipoprotein-sorting protein